MDQSMPQPGKSAKALDQSEPTAAIRILVVDDEPFIREINAKVLAHSGYQVDAAADGDAAWQALNAASYDLLITDHNMPKVTGLELLKKVRAARMALPVIMATATLPMEEFTRNTWLRPATILPKPYTAEELVGTVKELLRATSVFSQL
jgi:DNA-binding response OmpR family regulator